MAERFHDRFRGCGERIESRIPRVRFTIKRMMLATAVLALVMGCCKMAWLSSRYRKAAQFSASIESMFRQLRRVTDGDDKSRDDLALFLGLGPIVEDKVVRTAADRGFQKTVDYYAALRRKYERAAAWPWLAVEPDSPEPADLLESSRE
jgi:hypothetical protein